MEGGHQPTMAEVAVEARVSRATAYRYFDNVEALICEAAMDRDLKSAEEVFADFSSLDPVERVLRAEAEVCKIDRKYPLQLRISLANMIKRQVEATDGFESVPLRQNRRGEFIRFALAPVRDQIETSTYEKLCSAARRVLRHRGDDRVQDVVRISDDESREVKAWAIRALIEDALAGP